MVSVAKAFWRTESMGWEVARRFFVLTKRLNKAPLRNSYGVLQQLEVVGGVAENLGTLVSVLLNERLRGE